MSEYLTLGDGTTTYEAGVAFNSTKYPGTCKPSDFGTLAKFKALQEQLNRVAEKKGVAKIGVDGDIGPGTLGIMAKLGLAAAGTPCSAIAGYPTLFAAQARQLADTLGAPAKVSGPAPAKPPSIVTAGNVEIKAPPGAAMLGSLQNLSLPAKVAAVGIVGGIGFLLLTKKRRRK